MSARFAERWLETLCDLLADAHSAVFMVPNPQNDDFHLLARRTTPNVPLAQLADRSAPA